jgi:hypothetical protein
VEFISYFLQILLLVAVPPLAFGVAMYFCNRAFFSLVGYGRCRGVALAIHVLITPIREFSHLIACVLSMHRVHDFRLLNIYDPDGELGLVEHSYNRRNPLALFGNFLFAVMPAALGLFLLLVVVLCCFGGSFDGLTGELTALGEQGGGFGEYARLAFGFVVSMFRDATSGIFLKILGAVLLLFLSLGIYISLDDLIDGISGAIIFGVALFLFAGITAIACDDRTRRLIIFGVRSFSVSVCALFLVALTFAAAALVLGFGVFLIRSFLLPPATTAIVPVEEEYGDYDDYDER